MLRQADGAVFDLVVRPEIPVGDLAVEVVGKCVGTEALLPGFVQTDEIRDTVIRMKVGKNEVVEDLSVGTDGVGPVDVLMRVTFSRTSLT